MRLLARHEQHPRGIFRALYTDVEGYPIMYAVDRRGQQVKVVTIRDDMTDELAEGILEVTLRRAESDRAPRLTVVRGGLA